MHGSYMADADAHKWPIELRLLDTQMGFMHALQTYVYEMGSMAIEGDLDDVSHMRMRRVVECVESHIETWQQLRALALQSLRDNGDAHKAKEWEAIAAGIDTDMDLCIACLRDVLRG